MRNRVSGALAERRTAEALLCLQPRYWKRLARMRFYSVCGCWLILLATMLVSISFYYAVSIQIEEGRKRIVALYAEAHEFNREAQIGRCKNNPAFCGGLGGVGLPSPAAQRKARNASRDSHPR